MKNGAVTPLGCCFQSCDSRFGALCELSQQPCSDAQSIASPVQRAAPSGQQQVSPQNSILSFSFGLPRSVAGISCTLVSSAWFHSLLPHSLLSGSWIIIVFTIIGVVIVFDPLGGKKTFYLPDGVSRNLESSQSGQLLYNVKSSATRVWEKRIRLLCCCIVQDDDHRVAFTSIAELFRSYFSVRGRALLVFRESSAMVRFGMVLQFLPYLCTGH